MPLDSYVSLGRSGLRVSPFTLGAMTFGEDNGWGASPEESDSMISEYLYRGGNSIDTANMYTNGHSEKIIGDYLASRPGLRDRTVLGTKFFGNLWAGDPNGGGAGRKAIVAQAEESLRRLRTDYIDLYWLHNWDRTAPIAETMRALDDLVTAGKIRYIGISDLPAWKVTEAQLVAEFRGWTPAIALQVEYSLLARTIEGEYLDMAQHLGLGVMPWSPLRNGFLSGKFSRRNTGPVDGQRSTMTGQPTNAEHDVIDVLRGVAAEAGVTPAAAALSWVQHRPGVTSTLLGARHLDQLRANLDAVDVHLTDDQTRLLDKVSAPQLGFPAQYAAFTRDIGFAGATVDGVPSQVPHLLAKSPTRY
ncbi:MAG TPA: aldo/keto reductase [Pseudonocardia sp.]|nr:aldo/keto reductase [Pseudonocardia sp.]